VRERVQERERERERERAGEREREREHCRSFVLMKKYFPRKKSLSFLGTNQSFPERLQSST
jgi:hypothetical protein